MAWLYSSAKTVLIRFVQVRWALTPGEDLPALVVALAPLPEHDVGAVAHPAVVLVAVEGVEVEVDVVHHADAAEAVPDVAALRPQHRLVLVVGVVRHQLHLYVPRWNDPSRDRAEQNHFLISPIKRDEIEGRCDKNRSTAACLPGGPRPGSA